MATVQSANSTTFKFGRANNTNMNFYFKFIGTPNTTARTITCTIELWVKYAFDYDFTFFTSQGSYIKIGGTNLMTSNINYTGSGTVKLKTYTKTYSYDSNGQCKVSIDAVLKSNGVLNLYDKNTLGYSDAASRYNINMSLKTTVTLPSISAITGPSVPGNQKVNNTTTVTVLQKTDNLNLTWSAASGGTYGITGYKIYYSIGSGWVHHSNHQ